jgi:8-oxo-dGTP diphosphatase
VPLSEFTVAGALVESSEGILLVCNRRRNGLTDWSTPGGVIDADDETLLAGLTREVQEETGLSVLAWEGPLYEVRATAPDMGWALRCEVHRALGFEGSLLVEDPDGIVIEARFARPGECGEMLASCARWVREPLGDWIDARWGAHERREYAYMVHGADRQNMRAVRM